MKYARVYEGKVMEICVPISGFTIEQCFHVGFLESLVECTDEVQPGWTYDGSAFAAPVEETPPTE